MSQFEQRWKGVNSEFSYRTFDVHYLHSNHVCVQMAEERPSMRGNVLITDEMHNSYNQFLFQSFFCLLYMFRTNLVVHH